MDETLKENEIGLDHEEIDYLEITENEIYIPTVFLHFNDDLTEM